MNRKIIIFIWYHKRTVEQKNRTKMFIKIKTFRLKEENEQNEKIKFLACERYVAYLGFYNA